MAIIFKFVLAFSLLYFLVDSGKLDFSLTKKSLLYPLAWLLGILGIIINLFCGTIRWKIILENHKGFKISFLKALKFSWIGMFFNSVLPGSVSGDIIKMVYVKREVKDLSKTYLLVSIFLDRTVGLSALLFILGVFTLINTDLFLADNNSLTALFTFNLFLFAISISYLIAFYLPTSLRNPLHKLAKKIPYIGHHIDRALEMIWSLSSNHRPLWYGFLISILGQTCVILGYWFLISPFLNSSISVSSFFAFIPVGFISVAIPITPSGLGVGHLVYDKLFQFFNITNGASLFNLFFLASIGINLLGVIPYLFSSGRKISTSEMKDFNQAEAKL